MKNLLRVIGLIAIITTVFFIAERLEAEEVDMAFLTGDEGTATTRADTPKFPTSEPVASGGVRVAPTYYITNIDFDPARDCTSYLGFSGSQDLKNKLEQYQNNAIQYPDKLVICVQRPDQETHSIGLSININSVSKLPLVIYSLKLITAPGFTAPLLNISGLRVILHTASLEGPGVTAADSKAVVMSGIGHRIINSRINNFETAVKVDCLGANLCAMGPGDTFSNIVNGIIAPNPATLVYLKDVDFETIGEDTSKLINVMSVLNPINEEYIGKKISDEDSNMVTEIIGKIDTATCNPDDRVALYRHITIATTTTNSYTYTTTCPVSQLENELMLRRTVNDTSVLEVGTCVFKCSMYDDGRILNESLEDNIVLNYMRSGLMSSPFNNSLGLRQLSADITVPSGAQPISGEIIAQDGQAGGNIELGGTVGESSSGGDDYINIEEGNSGEGVTQVVGGEAGGPNEGNFGITEGSGSAGSCSLMVTEVTFSPKIYIYSFIMISVLAFALWRFLHVPVHTKRHRKPKR